jgi:hypothetical protein
MIRYRLICVDTAGSQAKAPPGRKAAGMNSAAKTPASSASNRVARGKATGCGQEFESWFQSSDAFEKLARQGQVACPSCGSLHVEKALMAPSVKTTKGKRAAAPPATPDLPAAGVADVDRTPRPLATLTPQQRAFVETMRKMREHVLSTSENVGKNFVQEARKIHYEEAETRSIHGEASIDEARALSEEGIDIFPIPELPDDRN